MSRRNSRRHQYNTKHTALHRSVITITITISLIGNLYVNNNIKTYNTQGHKQHHVLERMSFALWCRLCMCAYKYIYIYIFIYVYASHITITLSIMRYSNFFLSRAAIARWPWPPVWPTSDLVECDFSFTSHLWTTNTRRATTGSHLALKLQLPSLSFTISPHCTRYATFRRPHFFVSLIKIFFCTCIRI